MQNIHNVQNKIKKIIKIFTKSIDNYIWVLYNSIIENRER